MFPFKHNLTDKGEMQPEKEMHALACMLTIDKYTLPGTSKCPPITEHCSQTSNVTTFQHSGNVKRSSRRINCLYLQKWILAQ